MHFKVAHFGFTDKFGFRPIDKNINKLAEAEVKKIQKNKSYKSSIKILSQLATGNIALHINKESYCHRNEIINPIVRLITKQYKGNHSKAIQDAKAYFIKQAPSMKKRTATEEVIFEEIALWAYALKINDKTKLGIMTKMIQAKTRDYVLYNQLIKSIT